MLLDFWKPQHLGFEPLDLEKIVFLKTSFLSTLYDYYQKYFDSKWIHVFLLFPQSLPAMTLCRAMVPIQSLQLIGKCYLGPLLLT